MQTIHGALLAVRGNTTHEEELKTHNIPPIDMVVCNLYPFSETVQKVLLHLRSQCSNWSLKGGDFDTCIENIDIGLIIKLAPTSLDIIFARWSFHDPLCCQEPQGRDDHHRFVCGSVGLSSYARQMRHSIQKSLLR